MKGSNHGSEETDFSQAAERAEAHCASPRETRGTQGAQGGKVYYGARYILVVRSARGGDRTSPGPGTLTIRAATSGKQMIRELSVTDGAPREISACH